MIFHLNYRSVDVKECPLPESMEALQKFTISVVNPSVRTVVFSDPTNKSDILESVLRNIFHVSIENIGFASAHGVMDPSTMKPV